MTIPTAFVEKLRSKRSEVDAIKARLVTLEMEMRVWEEAARLLEPVDQPASETKQQAEQKDAPVKDDASRRRLRSGPKKLLTRMAERYPDGLSLDVLNAAAVDLGVDMSRGAIRSMMGGYVGRGYVERVSEGVFRITPTGAEVAEVALSAKSENSTSANESSQQTRENEADVRDADVSGENPTDPMPPSGSANDSEPSDWVKEAFK